MSTFAPTVTNAGTSIPGGLKTAPLPVALRSSPAASPFGTSVPECVVTTIAYLIPTLRQNRPLWLALKRSVECE